MGKTRRYKKDDWSFSGPTKQEREEAREDKLRSKRVERRTGKQKLKKSFKQYIREKPGLHEEYMGTAGKGTTMAAEVFMDPTSSEWKDIKRDGYGDARGFYDPKTKKIYVWPGALFHEWAYKVVGLKRESCWDFAIGFRERLIDMVASSSKMVKAITLKLKRHIPDIDKWEIGEF